MRRRWLLIPVALLVLLLVAVATLPWWLGWAAPRVAARFGATFASYERLGYARFAVNDVQVRRANVVVKVKRVEADTPALWTWRHLRGSDAPVVASDWSVEVAARTTPVPSGPSGWMVLRPRLQRIATALNRWLPQARTGAGVVRWTNGELRLASAHWEPNALSARELRYRSLAADVTVAFEPAHDVIKVTAADAPDGARATLVSRGAAISGNVAWWEQPVAVDAHFGTTGWLPPEATLNAASIQLPGDRLKLGGIYAMIAGRAQVDWRTDHFNADVGLRGEPVPERKAPPLEVTFRGRGDAKTFTLEMLHASLPGGVADLSAPVTIDRAGKLQGAGATLSVRADLAQQPWIPAKGMIVGHAQVTAGTTRTPSVGFQLSADSLALQGSALRRSTAEGRLDWPRLTVNHAEIAGAAGDRLEGSGGWDFREKRVIDATVRGNLKRDTLARWLPATLQFAEIAIDGRAAGAPGDLAHSGRAQISGLRVATLRAAEAQLEWQGRGPALPRFSATLAIGDARLHAEGAAERTALSLTAFTFVDHGVEELRLTAPARIAWRPSLAIDALHLAGPNATVDARLVWAAPGRIELALHGMRAAWIRSVMPLRGPDWTVASLALTGNWDGGPMTYSTAGTLVVPLAQGRTATFTLSSHGDAQGLAVDALHAEENGHSVVNASGRIPLTVAPGAKELVHLQPDGRLVLDASTVPNALFWQQLAEMTGVELRAPQVKANLNGTWAEPRGEVTFRAERAAMDPKRFTRPLPSVDDVDLAVVGDNDGVRLERLNVQVEGQQVRMAGRLPLRRSAWPELRRDPAGYVQREATARLEVPDAEVSKFSRFLPAALAPAGRLQADVRLERGTLAGFLRLRDAASRPLGPLGVLQDVSADVDFSDHQVNLRQVTATSGGQPITVTGFVGLPGLRERNGSAEPKYHVALRGQNLPFVRQAGLLVRGDLDLKLQSPEQGPPAITGKVVLRDSLFLTDVRAFLPHGGGASAARRPPYFSVETPPLNTWTLDIDVTGARFMRVRTPVFVGVASTRFHLGGTLGEPRAIGDATIDNGQVLMPFASFEVKQGAVRLTEENPYEPEIFLRGAGRHYGYDLTMEVSGKASAPNITFTSSPALDSEQVLLMVMTGAAPSNELSTSLTHRAVQIGAFFGQSLVGSLTGGAARPDRLSIESGEKISRQGKETYSIEYKVTDRLSVTGEYDEFDEYNAGIKWRVAPRKSER